MLALELNVPVCIAPSCRGNPNRGTNKIHYLSFLFIYLHHLSKKGEWMVKFCVGFREVGLFVRN